MDAFTPVPNWLIAAMPQMPASVFQVAVIIARQTTGYSDGNGGRREWERISVTQFEQATGLSRQGTQDAIIAGLGKWFDRRVAGQWFEYQLCNSVDYVTQLTMQLSCTVPCNSVAQSDPEVCNSVAQAMQLSCMATSGLKKVLKKDQKKEKERKGEAASPATPTPHAAAKGLHLDPKRRTLTRIDSPHLNSSRFDTNGFVPPGQGHNAVEVFYERCSIYDVRLSAPNEDDLIRNCPDLDRLREVIAVCDRRNYRKGNIDVILDLYRKGTQHGTHSGRPLASEQQNGAGFGAATGGNEPTGYDDDIPFDEERTRAAMAETQRRVKARLAAQTSRPEAGI